MKVPLLLCVGLLALVPGAWAGESLATLASQTEYARNFYAALGKSQKCGIFLRVVDAAGLRGYLSNANLMATFFPPDDIAFNQLLKGDMKISVAELLLPANKPLLAQLVRSLVVPGERIWTPQWPKFPKKVWLRTAQPGNRIGLEMDDGLPRPGDIFDVDGTDDDAELIPKSWLMNLRVGRGVMHLTDDVPTWKGWKAAVLRNVRAARG